MNLALTAGLVFGGPVPRARGDEPQKRCSTRPMPSPFPARAGMNRPKSAGGWGPYPVPRARGDEPDEPPARRGGMYPFPARAGMNRRLTNNSAPAFPVPRARGDEPPRVLQLFDRVPRSPRARG